jgi:hypothetical protein
MIDERAEVADDPIHTHERHHVDEGKSISRSSHRALTRRVPADNDEMILASQDERTSTSVDERIFSVEGETLPSLPSRKAVEGAMADVAKHVSDMSALTINGETPPCPARARTAYGGCLHRSGGQQDIQGG